MEESTNEKRVLSSTMIMDRKNHHNSRTSNSRISLSNPSLQSSLFLLLLHYIIYAEGAQLSLEGFECSSAYPVQLKNVYLTCENNSNKEECFFGDEAKFNGVCKCY